MKQPAAEWVLCTHRDALVAGFWCGLGNPNCRAAADVPSGAVYPTRAEARAQSRYLRARKMGRFSPQRLREERDHYRAEVQSLRAAQSDIADECEDLRDSLERSLAETAVTLQERDAARAEAAALRAALAEACDEYEYAVEYKGEYFAQKHGDAETLARLRAVLRGDGKGGGK